jgi:hypothetical protein
LILSRLRLENITEPEWSTANSRKLSYSTPSSMSPPPPPLRDSLAIFPSIEPQSPSVDFIARSGRTLEYA